MSAAKEYRMPNDIKEQLVSDLLQGMSRRQAMLKYNISSRKVIRIARRNNIPLKIGNISRVPSLVPKLLIDRKDGLTWIEISKKYNLSRETIIKQLNIAGIKEEFPKGFTRITKDEAVSLAKKVDRIGYIATAKESGYAQSTLRHAFKFYGIEATGTPNRIIFTESQKQEIGRLKYYGFNADYIASLFGYSKNTMFGLMKNYERLPFEELIKRSDAIKEKYPSVSDIYASGAVLSKFGTFSFWAYLGDI